MKNVDAKWFRSFAAATALVLLGLGLASSALAAPSPNASTVLTATPNPATLGPGTDVLFETTTTSSVGQPYIDQGKVTIQYATDGLGNPVPAAAAILWVALNSPGVSPVAGETSLAVDLDALGFVPGTTGGFRAHYVTGGGQIHADTHFSDAIDVTAIGACTGVTIAADLGAGNGAPAPGDSGPWTFDIVVSNCTGVDLTNVKVQGGTNGWAPMTGFDTSGDGSVSVRNNNRNQVLTWIVSIPNGETRTISVTVNGKIPKSSPCSVDPNAPAPGSVRFLSGAWSAVYDAGAGPQKSDYTGRVSIVVTCAAP